MKTKTYKASAIVVNDKEEYIDNPYFKLQGGRTIDWDDVYYADWRDNEGQVEAAFRAGRSGAGDLVSLNCGDDGVYLTTTDKVKKSKK